jgi:delta1-piperideine-2-carboxylate reductase
MMIEIMGAALTGGKFSYEVDWSGHPGAKTPHTGQFFLIIDPSRGAMRDFAARVEALVSRMHDAGVDRQPGDRRYASRRMARERGIPIGNPELDRLHGLAVVKA